MVVGLVKKDAQLTIRLSSDLKASLQAAAAKRDRKTNWLVGHILEQWVGRRTRRK